MKEKNLSHQMNPHSDDSGDCVSMNWSNNWSDACDVDEMNKETEQVDDAISPQEPVSKQ